MAIKSQELIDEEDKLLKQSAQELLKKVEELLGESADSGQGPRRKRALKSTQSSIRERLKSIDKQFVEEYK